MNSKGHLTFSLVKSVLRIIGGILLGILASRELLSAGMIAFAISFVGAEVLGIFEELVDER